MATTTNYGWDTPDDTDLVKDGAAAIRTLGSSVDTTTKALNPSTTLGDIEYRSSTANTNTRLGIGTTGQVLTVTGGVPAWGTVTAGGTGGYTLLNAGGTALSGSASVVVSGITSNDLLIMVVGAASVNASAGIFINFNSATTNHNARGMRIVANSSYAASNFDQVGDSNSNGFILAYGSTTAGRPSHGYVMVQACKSTSIKPYWYAGANDGSSGTGNWSQSAGGFFDAAAAITSVQIRSNSGNFNAGTIFVYGRD
jgi:hypothetical protein